MVVELARENEGFMGDVLSAAPLHSDSAVRRLGWALEEVVIRGGTAFHKCCNEGLSMLVKHES